MKIIFLHPGDIFSGTEVIVFLFLIVVAFVILSIVIPLYFLWDPAKPKKGDRSHTTDTPESEERIEI